MGKEETEILVVGGVMMDGMGWFEDLRSHEVMEASSFISSFLLGRVREGKTESSLEEEIKQIYSLLLCRAGLLFISILFRIHTVQI